MHGRGIRCTPRLSDGLPQGSTTPRPRASATSEYPSLDGRHPGRHSSAGRTRAVFGPGHRARRSDYEYCRGYAASRPAVRRAGGCALSGVVVEVAIRSLAARHATPGVPGSRARRWSAAQVPPGRSAAGCSIWCAIRSSPRRWPAPTDQPVARPGRQGVALVLQVVGSRVGSFWRTSLVGRSGFDSPGVLRGQPGQVDHRPASQRQCGGMAVGGIHRGHCRNRHDERRPEQRIPQTAKTSAAKRVVHVDLHGVVGAQFHGLSAQPEKPHAAITRRSGSRRRAQDAGPRTPQCHVGGGVPAPPPNRRRGQHVRQERAAARWPQQHHRGCPVRRNPMRPCTERSPEPAMC